MTNEAFAQATGCTFTMASRLRNGRRLPSAALLIRIMDAYDLDAEEILLAHQGGPEIFGQYIRKMVYGLPE